jgi:7,8-dihydropterin-6-yl-methyl-4-(beta-D-ribofuranosyl)aminobenzene 5'-phosphate synthase
MVLRREAMRRLALIAVLLVAVMPFGVHAQEEEASGTVRITILYDNYAYKPTLKSDWGFAALIETGDQVILFDTGASGSVLLKNMAALEVDPARITTLIFSHIHEDHTAGVRKLFDAGAHPQTIYVLPSFPQDFKDRMSEVGEVVEVESGLEIAPGVVSTGELTGGETPEEALLISTAEGIVVLTGCAHPGIVRIVQRANTLTDQPIRMAMGGFHLLETDPGSVDAIIARLQDLGVEQIAPSHCTGDYAIRQFKTAYGDNFVRLSVGVVLEFPVPEPEPA